MFTGRRDGGRKSVLALELPVRTRRSLLRVKVLYENVQLVGKLKLVGKLFQSTMVHASMVHVLSHPDCF